MPKVASWVKHGDTTKISQPMRSRSNQSTPHLGDETTLEILADSSACLARADHSTGASLDKPNPHSLPVLHCPLPSIAMSRSQFSTPSGGYVQRAGMSPDRESTD